MSDNVDKGSEFESIGLGSESLNKKLLNDVISISENAALAIMEVYNSAEGIEVQSKADDSPLTQADLASHHSICDALAVISDFPILSEEAADIPAEERLSWETYWLIDPLDGTKEFVARNNEFTVNIALIHKHEAVLGVVYVPPTKECYFAMKGHGAFKTVDGETRKITTRKLDLVLSKQQPLAIVASRRHGADALDKLLENLALTLGPANLVSKGSSLKFCLIAEGKADCYPRLALTCEWDTAAAQIVLEEAGGAVLTDKLETMRYNAKEALLNPFFYALGDDIARWKALLKQ